MYKDFTRGSQSLSYTDCLLLLGFYACSREEKPPLEQEGSTNCLCEALNACTHGHCLVLESKTWGKRDTPLHKQCWDYSRAAAANADPASLCSSSTPAQTFLFLTGRSFPPELRGEPHASPSQRKASVAAAPSSRR